jgi:hypothetical protein
MTDEKAGQEWLERYTEQREALIAANAYDPADEKDSCGVGLVAQIDGTPRREIVEMAIRALKAVYHRGAVDADGKTGDGAGIRVDVPQDFFRDAVRGMGHAISDDRQVCVGQIFLPRTDLAAQEKARSIIETEVVRFGFYIYGWRQPPIDTSVIGMKANATRPEIEQILFTDTQGRDQTELERTLYVCRRRIEKLDVAYHDYEGLALRTEEQARLVASLGEREVMILRNHGLLACAASIPPRASTAGRRSPGATSARPPSRGWTARPGSSRPTVMPCARRTAS